MAKTSTKTKPARDKSGRFASQSAKRVRKPRQTKVPFNPVSAFGYDDDAVELPSEPYTSPRVERNKALEQEAKERELVIRHMLFHAVLLFAAMALSFLLGATQDWGWR